MGDLKDWAGSVAVNVVLLSAALIRTGFDRKKRWCIYISSFIASS